MFTKNLLKTTKSISQKSFVHSKTITLIPGDGIGKETTDCVVDLFKAAHIPVNVFFKKNLTNQKVGRSPT
jgi:isocitrate dehydrogenase (NAD+)